MADMQWEYCSSHDNFAVFYGDFTYGLQRYNGGPAVIYYLGLARWERVGVAETRLYFKRLVMPGRAVDDVAVALNWQVG
jgi:hypothetical protein